VLNVTLLFDTVLIIIIVVIDTLHLFSNRATLGCQSKMLLLVLLLLVSSSVE
jgi:hypothetical protein